MEDNKLKKWGSLIAFIVLAAISCWATEHSFHLLINFMPEAFVWGVTIAFFIVASYGTKLIVDALNQNIYLEHRRRDFWIGVVLVVIFWLLMSMPTNTHTFFYKHKIGGVAQEDIAMTQKYLNQIKNRSNIDSTYYVNVYTPVTNIFNDLAREFNGLGVSGQRGNGQYVHDLLTKMNAILSSQPNGIVVPFVNSWNVFDPTILNGYQAGKNASLDAILDNNYKVLASEAREASRIFNYLDVMNDTIKQMIYIGDIHEDVIAQAEGVIMSGYTSIKNNQKFVKFENKEEENLYTAENLETKTRRMTSVIDVWLDFFNGKYPLSFMYYILLSILVDVAAFMFFDFAFKKED